MNLVMDNVYLLFCLLSLMVFEMSAKTLRNRYEGKRQKRAIVESSECQQSVARNGMTLFNAGIKTLKGEGADINGNFLGELKSIYNILENNPNSASDRIEEGLRNLNDYRSFPKTPAELKPKLIELYTSKVYHTELNTALNQHACTNKPSLADFDKGIAAYATALFAVLLYWPELNTCSQTTYRGVSVPNIQETLKDYQEGDDVVYKAFTSSSIEEDVAFDFMKDPVKNILLVFDNSQNNFWKPRDIETYSEYTKEKECVYPPAAKFRVTSIPRNFSKNGKAYHEIHLQIVEETPTDNTSLVQFSGYTILFSMFLTSTFM
uniref:NAD(P)(+)--arginine ADP-ribosyltransferase n=1 Tax=Crassostrea virginica TaxID=6565 RepID=A0A8B8AXX8_CRAVI|nr:uncharacterized protein LOC111105874 [Crassostrea virginica]